jgi:general secretion pathway protein D
MSLTMYATRMRLTSPKTLQDVLGGGTSAPAAAPAVAGGPVAAAPRATSSGTLASGGRVVVNTAANSIIIQSTPAEYQQIYALLQELDRPPRSALIMATVAEVRLSDTEQFGFSWLLKQFSTGGYNVNTSVGPTPVAGTSAAGLALSIATIAGDPRALLTALASSNRVRVLSNPSIVALSGYEASIQVGEDVPILTSQISNANTTGTDGTGGVLQTVQYRSVGIILKVRPVVHAGGRVDLELQQEVSGVSSNNSGLGNSPVVSTRRIQTRLSARDGNTMLLGGLIREQRDGGHAGIPFFKDIPVAGSLFRTSGNDNFERTELVVLLTPYVIEDDFDSRAITNAFRSQFGWATTPDGGTLPLGPRGAPSATAVDRADGVQQPSAAAGTPAPTAPASKTYVVPDAPALQLVPARALAPLPPAAGAASSLPATPIPAPARVGGGDAATTSMPQNAPAPAKGAGPAITQGARPLTDDKLRQELLDAVKRAN